MQASIRSSQLRLRSWSTRYSSTCIRDQRTSEENKSITTRASKEASTLLGIAIPASPPRSEDGLKSEAPLKESGLTVSK